jgi:hypothetical protein
MPSYPWNVTRYDVAADLYFGNAGYGSSFIRALTTRRLPKGRVWHQPKAGTEWWAMLNRPGKLKMAVAYDKGVESRACDSLRWFRLEGKWTASGEEAMAFSTLTPGAMAWMWDDRFRTTVTERGTVIGGGDVIVTLAEMVSDGRMTPLQFDQLVGFLSAERLGLAEKVYGPDTLQRRKAMAREFNAPAQGVSTEGVSQDLFDILSDARSALV